MPLHASQMPEHDARLRLIELLADGKFHSGVQLATLLDVSRAAIWKQIRALQNNFGLSIESHRSKGYRLPQPLELLSKSKILSLLNDDTRDSLHAIHIHPIIDSTNTWLMSQAVDGMPSGSVCLAERQIQGRGRHGRIWVSPFGSNIYLSLLWRYDLSLTQLGGLSIACGVAVAQALHQFGVSGHALKWPNDVLWQRRKLAGLLLEVKGEVAGPSLVVVGIGLNTALTEAEAAEIDQPWVSLSHMPDVDARCRNNLAALLIKNLSRVMLEYPNTGLSPYLRQWERFDHYRGERVCLQIGPRLVCGEYLGVAYDGSIRILVNGIPRSYNVGEVQLNRALE